MSHHNTEAIKFLQLLTQIYVAIGQPVMQISTLPKSKLTFDLYRII